MKYVYLTQQRWQDDDPDFEVDDMGVTIMDGAGLYLRDENGEHWIAPGCWYGITTAEPKPS